MPQTVLDIAVRGTINTFDFCKKKRIKELFLASSSEVYSQPKKIPTTEKEELKIPDIFNPRYSYSGGKILTELLGITYGKTFFRKLIIFTFANHVCLSTTMTLSSNQTTKNV